MKRWSFVLLVGLQVGCSGSSGPAGSGAPTAAPPRLVVASMQKDKLVFEIEKEETVVTEVPFVVTVNKVVDGKKIKEQQQRVKKTATKIKRMVTVESDASAFRILDSDGRRVDAERTAHQLRRPTVVLQCEKFDRYYMQIVNPGTLVLVGDGSVLDGQPETKIAVDAEPVPPPKKMPMKIVPE